MRSLKLADGARVPLVGQGTWHMGENPPERGNEIAALRLGIELGMTLIDTAEMYAEGGAEEVVGEAIRSCRDQVFLVSKVYPHNASRKGVPEACERSLRRLGTRLPRSLPVALARQIPAGGNGWRGRAFEGGRKDSPLGRIEPGSG